MRRSGTMPGDDVGTAGGEQIEQVAAGKAGDTGNKDAHFAFLETAADAAKAGYRVG